MLWSGWWNKYNIIKNRLEETKPQINQDAVRLMKKLYGIDMEKTQYSKTFDKIPVPDIAISMGCDVGCPYIGGAFDDNWGLKDPTGQSDDVFIEVIEEIKNKVLLLCEENNLKWCIMLCCPNPRKYAVLRCAI